MCFSGALFFFCRRWCWDVFDFVFMFSPSLPWCAVFGLVLVLLLLLKSTRRGRLSIVWIYRRLTYDTQHHHTQQSAFVQLDFRRFHDTHAVHFAQYLSIYPHSGFGCVGIIFVSDALELLYNHRLFVSCVTRNGIKLRSAFLPRTYMRCVPTTMRESRSAALSWRVRAFCDTLHHRRDTLSNRIDEWGEEGKITQNCKLLSTLGSGLEETHAYRAYTADESSSKQKRKNWKILIHWIPNCSQITNTFIISTGRLERPEKNTIKWLIL